MKIQWNLIVLVYQDIERFTLVWKTRKFREELKWNGSSRWKFSGKKVIPFEVLPFFPFLPKRPKYSVPFVWITSAMQASSPEKANNLPVFCKWNNSIPFLFSVQKKYQYHLTEIFHRNFRTNVKRS